MVLSRGMNKRSHVRPDTCRYLEERSITVHMAGTRDAVNIYNELTDDTLVAGLFHDTHPLPPIGEHPELAQLDERSGKSFTESPWNR